MTPPTIPGWNLALRFGLELTALAGLGLAAWRLTSGNLRWLAVVTVPLVAAMIWGTFNVLDDPSRSGEAPVEVPGAIRLGIELLVLGGGAAALAVAGRSDIAVVFAGLIAAHYLTTTSRIEWLLDA